MNWINEYKEKAKRVKLRAAFLLLASIILLVISVLIGNGAFAAVALISFAVCIFFAFLSLGCKVIYRKYNNNYICVYIGLLKNYLIINDEVQYEGGFTTQYFYGQLPDGTEVTVKISGFGDVKFAIGAFNNHNVSYF